MKPKINRIAVRATALAVLVGLGWAAGLSYGEDAPAKSATPGSQELALGSIPGFGTTTTTKATTTTTRATTTTTKATTTTTKAPTTTTAATTTTTKATTTTTKPTTTTTATTTTTTAKAPITTSPPVTDRPFPRLGGMNIGAKNYDSSTYQQQLARLDLVILGFYKGWNPTYGIRKVVQNIKALSPYNILVGQYTLLNETYNNPNDAATADLQSKVNAENWWARNAAGKMVQWTTAFGTWEINITSWAKPDANGLRWPQWRADRDYRTYFQPVPEFDIWFFDNVFKQPRVVADWDRNGTDDAVTNATTTAAYRAGHAAEWARARADRPGILLIGNCDSDMSQPEYKGQLDGCYLEGLMGLSWSVETWGGWTEMMKRYRGAMANTRAPHLVMFNTQGASTNYKLFRYGFTSCLLDDGYFAYTDMGSYSSVYWFDEYNYVLGAARTSPPTVAWKSGVWRRDFDNGIVLVNPTSASVTVTVEPGFVRIKGAQAPTINTGAAVTSVTLASKDGIVLLRQ